MERVVWVKNLYKRYGEVTAVNDVSFEISSGEVFGLLGPNGAEKTTIIEILEGLRKQDQGEAFVFGLDPQKDHRKLKEIIGVQLQSTAFHKRLKVSEVGRQFSSYYKRCAGVEEWLKQLDLWEKKNSRIDTLSGGQRQRLAILLALLNDPEIVFLDEPTRDLDPQGRHLVWGIIEKIKKQKRTLILTTHYIEEAEKLCDRVAIMDAGKVLVLDSPANLVGANKVQLRFKVSKEGTFELQELKSLSQVFDLGKVDDEYILWVKSVESAIVELVEFLQQKKTTFSDLHISRASLEDVFIKITGKRMSHESPADGSGHFS